MSRDELRFPTQAFINGAFVDTKRTYDLINPATGEVLAAVADCGEAEARQAADAAHNAFLTWKQTTAYQRSAIMETFVKLLQANSERLAQIMTAEIGKPIKESRGEVKYATGFVQWYAEEAKRIYGETIPSSFSDKRILVEAAPVGPVFAITPWNFPAAMITRKLAPALAAGCTFIIKPPAQSAISALAMAELLQEAGLPDGVFQVIPTSQSSVVSDVLLADPRIRKLAFTGSTHVGTLLAEKAARTVKRVSLELGGHAPFLVFEDADVEKAAAEAMNCKFRNAGQTCICTNRIYVQESIKDAFLQAFLKRVADLKVGAPIEEDTDIGPLVNQQGLDKAKEHIADALEKGAQMVAGQEAPAQKGLFLTPTVLTGVTHDMVVAREETFGPVAPIMTFKDEAEAIALANDTPYGLAAYVFTRDVSRVYRVTDALDYGIIGVNDGVPSTPQAPFGGMKASGVGREGGHYGLEEYLERKFISLKL